MKNRRRTKRFKTNKKVMLGEEHPEFLASTLNISKNGIAIESDRAFFTNSKITVKFYSAGWVMMVDGVVKWMRPDMSRTFYKIGIKFLESLQESYKLPLH